MFTGIVTSVGEVRAVDSLDGGKRFGIFCSWELDDIEIGSSISHDGVCLTVTKKSGDLYYVEVWDETLRLTTADSWGNKINKLNLERSLRVGDELGGHIVLGHIDDTSEILACEDVGDSRRFELSVPDSSKKLISTKGSVCLNGVSLTVNDVTNERFGVLLIRHTLDVTTWGDLSIGDFVNLEVDSLARYAERILSP